ncbi:MAG: ATP-dependent protease subunit HslV [Candidatus Bipolaricaulis sibiricus]|uniref:ATP-dependent protease subunit HslV n=1 Tax=Bipolaricaulis sibiricus TaxID=2501609 RepID=A0A410FS47_BIPS1|nr:MAG: ATP-dependent protease subunit HslV [Candidatus Bipolaricaulis sibiricus]
MISSTILALRSEKDRMAVMACDGQATMESRVVKAAARKVHRIHGGRVLAGFSGGTADGMTLLERLEAKIASGGNLRQAAVELSREWRTDRTLRRLEAVVVAVSEEALFLLTGEGDVIEPDDGLVGIGSGGGYAVSAARALLRHARLPVVQVAQEALRIASELDIYTNDCVTLETVTW